jgi:Protein of unknown function (DUF1761)
MGFENVNWIAVIVAAVVAVVIVAGWYSRYLFGPRWLAAIGKGPDEMGSPPTAIAFAFVGYLVMATVLARVMPVGVSAGVALMWGFMVWIGFIATATLIAGAFEGKIGTAQWIYLGNGLVVSLLMAMIIAVIG